MSKRKITGKVLVIRLGREETQIALLGKKPELLHTLTVETPAGAVEDGMIRNGDAIIGMLKAALKKAKEDGAEVTDDCSAVERMGMAVKIVEGDERNIKVTTPLDLTIAKLLLEEMK